MAANGDILPGTYTAYDKGIKSPNPLTLMYVDGNPVNSRMYNDLINIKNAALEAGITLLVNSGYRDAFNDIEYDGQQLAESQLTLRKQNVKPEYTDKNVADSSLSPLSEYFSPATAAPGYSKHNNGKAVDFNTGSRTGNIVSPLNDDLYSWLIRNSWKYGFVRTVSTEEWHFEWIGITAAKSGPYTILSPSPVIKDPSKYPNNCYYEDLGLNNLRLIDGEYISVTPGQPIPLSNV